MDELEPITKPRIGLTLWREKWIIVASIVVMIGLAGLYVLRAAKVYQASAIIQFNVPTSAPGSSDTTAGNQALAQNYATVLVSPGFLSEIRSQVDGGKLSAEGLASRLTATVVQNSALITLQATGSSPQEAQRIDGQVAHAFLANLRNNAIAQTQQLQGELNVQISAMTAQINTLRAKPSTSAIAEQINQLTASRQALINQSATVTITGYGQGESATLSAAPQSSSTPISPKKSLDLLAGAVLGVLLGVALAWARQALRPAIHSAEDVTALVDLPLLASIPLKSRFKPDDPTLPEAYGVLHANLMFALRTGNVRIVTLVGYNPQVGKTSTVEGLARAAARGDQQILLVDGDMRAATLSARFGQREHPGMVDVLQGSVPLDEALVQVESGLWLLPTHPARANAAGLLAGSRTLSLMGDLRERFDLVLIDTPPLAGLADGLILASVSDAVVLVVRTGVTKPADLTAATNSLLHNQAPIAGVVVFEELPVEPYYTGKDEAPTAAAVS